MIPDLTPCLPCTALGTNHARKMKMANMLTSSCQFFCFVCPIHKTCSVEYVFVFLIYLPDILVLRNTTHSLDCSLVEQILAVSNEAVFKPCFFL